MQELLPSPQCFHLTGQTNWECYGVMRNFTGLIAMISFIGILLTSLEYVRRKHYRVFYCCHVVLAPLGMLTVIMHWSKTLLFILPSIVLYSISLSFSIWDSVLSRMSNPDGTTFSGKRVPGSADLHEMTINADFSTAQKRPLPGQWVRIRDIDSSSWLPEYCPFSIASVDYSASTFSVVYRAVGPFTKKLAQSSRVQIEGFHGPSGVPCHVFSHCMGCT